MLIRFNENENIFTNTDKKTITPFNIVNHIAIAMSVKISLVCNQSVCVGCTILTKCDIMNIAILILISNILQSRTCFYWLYSIKYINKENRTHFNFASLICYVLLSINFFTYTVTLLKYAHTWYAPEGFSRSGPVR